MRAALPLVAAAALGAAACAASPDAAAGDGDVAHVAVTRAAVPAGAFGGIETRLLDGDLVSFLVTMDASAGRTDVADYARCAAAQYALIRGYGFARHIRTNIVRTGSNWRGDAVYTVSPTLPRGLATIDAEVTVRDCGARGIPTV